VISVLRTRRRERSMDLHRAILRLEPLQQAVLSLHYFAGYSHQELAELFDRTPDEIDSILDAAVEELRQVLPGDVAIEIR